MKFVFVTWVFQMQKLRLRVVLLISKWALLLFEAIMKRAIALKSNKLGFLS